MAALGSRSRMDPVAEADKRVIACNLTERTREGAVGSLAYVLGVPGDPSRVRVLLRSRSGRWITKWESLSRLGNFRLKTLPPAHGRHADVPALDELGHASLERLATAKALTSLTSPVDCPTETDTLD
jgi:hypothetical protein